MRKGLTQNEPVLFSFTTLYKYHFRKSQNIELTEKSDIYYFLPKTIDLYVFIY